MRGRRSLAPALGLLTLALGLAGCRSAAAPRTAVVGHEPPWEVPADELRRQSLYRVQLRAGEERGTLRLVLRLWDPERFELAASDALGRTLWTLRAAGGSATWSDRERDSACALATDRAIRWPRFGLTLPASYLPRLLLGRLPEPPAGASDADPAAEKEVPTTGGRRLRYRVTAGLPITWTLLSATSDAVLSWSREGDGGRLEAAGSERLEIRWRRVSREPVTGAPPPPPADGLAECDLDAVP